MNEINNINNNNNVNIIIDKNHSFKKVKLNSISNNTHLNEITCNDTITINEKNKNIINTKKAYDAFKDTCKDIGYITNSLGTNVDMSYYYVITATLMEKEGITVPSFVFDSNNSDFVTFVDNLHEFSKNLNATNPGFLPSQFLDFCDAFKEKLIQYGCK